MDLTFVKQGIRCKFKFQMDPTFVKQGIRCKFKCQIDPTFVLTQNLQFDTTVNFLKDPPE